MTANQSNHSSVEATENLLSKYFEMWLRALLSCRHSRHQATMDQHAGEAIRVAQRRCLLHIEMPLVRNLLRGSKLVKTRFSIIWRRWLDCG